MTEDSEAKKKESPDNEDIKIEELKEDPETPNIERSDEKPAVQLAWTVDWPHKGRELRLSPDGERIYWFDPRVTSPVGIFSTESPELLGTLKTRGWRVVDIAFGDDPGKIYLHFAMPKYNGVAVLNPTADKALGRARLYDRTGWIIPRSDTDEVILFTAGADRVTHFRIYNEDSWSGEQNYKPE